MFCPKCGGEQASDEMRFCSRCGMPLGGVADLLSNEGKQRLLVPTADEVDEPKNRRVEINVR